MIKLTMSEWNLPHDYTFDGREVRYGVIGNGPALVIVHGTPWSSFNMRHLINALSRKFSVHYYDLLGYGQSDKAVGDVSLGIQNQLLSSLLDHWNLVDPFIIGHDFGGTTVLRTHLLNQCTFKKLILIDPVSISPWGSPFFHHVKKHEQAFSGTPEYIHEAIVRAYIKTAAFMPIDEEVLSMTVRPWLGTDGQAAFYRQIAQANSIYTDEVQHLYPTIKTPTLILWGREDTWIPVEKGALLHAEIPDSVFHTIPNAGHLVIEEQPQQLAEKIETFMS